jgi:hypothetical protein
MRLCMHDSMALTMMPLTMMPLTMRKYSVCLTSKVLTHDGRSSTTSSLLAAAHSGVMVHSRAQQTVLSRHQLCEAHAVPHMHTHITTPGHAGRMTQEHAGSMRALCMVHRAFLSLRSKELYTSPACMHA